MTSSTTRSEARVLRVLHPAFFLTGIVHASGGALLPAISSALHLADSQSGLVFSAYYAGTAGGALLCGINHKRSMTIGFLGLALASIAIATVSSVSLLLICFLAAGIGVGMPMSAVSIYAGSLYGDRSAAPLTFLNFSWSTGALIAPLLASALLRSHPYQTAYFIFAALSLLAAVACMIHIPNTHSRTQQPAVLPSSLARIRWIVIFALLTFLEVGIENTTATWLATFALRSSHSGAAQAAASTALYWWGFLVSRAVFSFALLRIRAIYVLFINSAVALVAALALLARPAAYSSVAMVFLGASLAPIFPVMLARFFALNGRSTESRWVLAVCGFGGSVLPWFTGLVSSQTGSLRTGLAVVPAALFLILLVLVAAPSLSKDAHP